MTEETKYTHIGVEKVTQRKIAILALALTTADKKIKMYELVADWADSAWQAAKATGKVTDEMLPAVEHPSAVQLILPE